MKKIPVIIDTDPGVDDAAAILLALAAPELDVRAITVMGGNVPLDATTRNALKIVEIAKHRDVPVYAGAPGPLVRQQVFGRYAHIGAFADEILPAPTTKPADGHAVSFIANVARDATATGKKITLACLGPLTNIALALMQDQRVAEGIERIVMMGGAFEALGHRTPWAEFNIYADPHAAHVVFTSGVPVVMFPLDITFQALLQESGVARFETAGGAPGRALAALLRRFDRSDIARFGRPGAPLHDAMVTAFLVAPDLFAGRRAYVGVECQSTTAGHTWADFHGKLGREPNAWIMEKVDEAGFLELLDAHIARYGAA
jgi:purine nucleosidase